MGIYIKGMKMPEYGVLVLKIDPEGNVCTTARNDFKKYKAIELPPHGDLINRDHLEVVSYHNSEGMEDTFDNGVKWMLEYIDKLTPVIPADTKGGADG